MSRGLGILSMGRAMSVMIAVIFAAAAGPAAEARIVCKNGAQKQRGQWIVTPYCQDALLGKVARQYGVRVSDSALRNNPNRKRHVCRFVGQDIRVRDTCRQVHPHGGRIGL
ncbi:MAG: hypothetical protein K0U34_09095 [Alphaproteobacteria bacterium]|nr:hypothetical protein [Alphaproteobacteria bacterium]